MSLLDYTSAKASLEALTEDWASDVAVRLAEMKANSRVLSCQQMLRSVSTPSSKCKPRRQRKNVVEKLAKTNLPPIPSGPMTTIDQTAYEFYK